MKKLYVIVVGISLNLQTFAIGSWTQKSNVGGGGRYGAVGFSIGDKGYIATGRVGSVDSKELWEWDQFSDTWTQKSDLPGLGRRYATGFSIGRKGYIGTGLSVGTYLTDFWEWDQASNSWTQKAPLPGNERYWATGFSIGNKGYIGFGMIGPGQGLGKDFYEWDQATNKWIKKSVFTNSGSWAPLSFVIGKKGFVATGWNYQTGPKTNLWEWEQVTNIWTQKANFPGSPRYGATAFVIGNFAYAGLGDANFSSTGGNVSDFYRYNSINNSWDTIANMPGGANCWVASFSIDCYGYVGTGNGDSFWEFYDSTNFTCCPVQASLPNDTICLGSSQTLTGAYGGISYLWNTGETSASIVVAPSTTTTYSVIETFGNCSDTLIGTIAVVPAPTPVITGNNTICDGSVASLSATGGTTYLWSNNSTSPTIYESPSATTSYSVTVSIGSCSKDTSATVVVLTSPTITVTGPDTICSGQTITISTTGGTSYLWNTGTTGATLISSPTTTSSYVASTTIANGCSDSDSILVQVIPIPSPQIAGNTTICEGSQSQLTVSGGTNYLWNSGSTSTAITPVLSGIYSVVASNWKCYDSTSTYVTVHPLPTAFAGNDTTIQYGDNATLTGSGTGSYYWMPGGNAGAVQIVSPVVQQTYTLFVTDSNGCVKSDLVTILLDDRNCKLFIPNAFSPNADGYDDQYFIFGKCIAEFELSIFDRWGEKVFKTNDLLQGWDGTYKGQVMNTGVFLYVVNGKMLNGENFYERGNITLIR